MSSGAAFSFFIFLLYLGLGIYLSRRSASKEGMLAPVHVSFGAIYLMIAFAYLFTGLQQVFHQAGRPLPDEACAYLAQCVAFAVMIPAAYFSTFLLFGNIRLSWYLLIVFLVVSCIACGLAGTSPRHVVEYSWGSAWDFDSVLLKVYYAVAGSIPSLAALVGFIILIVRHLDTRESRYRAIFIAASLACILFAWMVMPSDREYLVAVSRILAMLGSFLGYLAYSHIFLPARDEGPA